MTILHGTRLASMADLSDPAFVRRVGRDPAGALQRYLNDVLRHLSHLSPPGEPTPGLTIRHLYWPDQPGPGGGTLGAWHTELWAWGPDHLEHEVMSAVQSSPLWIDFLRDDHQLLTEPDLDLSAWSGFVECVNRATIPRLHRSGETVGPETPWFVLTPMVADDSATCKRIELLLDSTFVALRSPCVVDLAFQRCDLGHLAADVADLIRQLSSRGQDDLAATDVRSVRAVRRAPWERRPPTVEAYETQWRDAFEIFFGRSNLYRFQFRCAAQDREKALYLAESLASGLTGSSDFDLVEGGDDLRQAFNSLECPVSPPVSLFAGRDEEIQEEWGTTRIPDHVLDLEILRRVLPEALLQPLLQLPAAQGSPLRTGFVETDRRRPPRQVPELCNPRPDDALLVGGDLERSRPLVLPLRELVRHAFLAGITGSGKTTTLFNLLVQAVAALIRFLVFEPVKREHRRLLLHPGIGSEVRIYTPGNDLVAPMYINLFEFEEPVTLCEHIAMLEDTFAAAIPAEDPVPLLFSELFWYAYEQKGWTEDSTPADGLEFPVLSDLIPAVDAVMADKYQGEVQTNIRTALLVRLRGLCRGAVGRMFAARRSVPSISELLSENVIVELDALTPEQANLVTFERLNRCCTHLRRRDHSGRLENLIVLEEAHNLVGRTETMTAGEQSASLRATRLITRMLAEERAHGVGIVIADQTPAAVAKEVIKNTAVKIAHQTVDGEDRECLASAMAITDERSLELARLAPGEALIIHGELFEAVRVLNLLVEGLPAATPSDAELRSLIEHRPWFASTVAEGIPSRAVMIADLRTSIRDTLSDLADIDADTTSGQPTATTSSLRSELRESLKRDILRVDRLLAAASKDASPGPGDHNEDPRSLSLAGGGEVRALQRLVERAHEVLDGPDGGGGGP